MANLYKDADKRRKVIPGGGVKTEEETEVNEAVVTTEEEPASEPPKAPEQPSEEKKSEPAQPDPAPVNDILADLIPKKPKPKPETYGFYLDSDVHDELVKLAKANKTNKSKFLNALLRRVLFNE